jgi:DNA-binding PucR family transcriptional regulator
LETERLLRELARGRALEPFRALVEPLVEHDRERRSDLVKTLKVYFDTGANASEAADQLFLHRNSILYRLSHVEKLTGLNLKAPRARLALQLGLLDISVRERSADDATEHP